MKLKITEELFRYMVLGSSVYSTGGGLELSVQLKMFSKISDSIKKVNLVSIDILNKNEYICAAYGVGSANNSDLDLSEELQKNKKILEKYTGNVIKGVFAGETNIDILAIDAARCLNVPLIDADCTGGRAVPEVQFDNFFIKNISTLPIAVSSENTSLLITNADKINNIDELIRKVAIESRSKNAVVIDHLINASQARNILTTGIFIRSIKMGKFIEKLGKEKELKKKFLQLSGGTIIFEGIISYVELKDNKDKGFLEGFYTVENKNGDVAKIYVKNENIVCWINNKVKILPPDSILTIDSESFIGIHNSKIKKGQEIFIVNKKADKLWSSKKGRELFSYKNFNISLK